MKFAIMATINVFLYSYIQISVLKSVYYRTGIYFHILLALNIFAPGVNDYVHTITQNKILHACDCVKPPTKM